MKQCGKEPRLQADAPVPLISEQEANLTAHHKEVFSPQERLPNEVLRYIFVLVAEECDPVKFPFRTLPAQLMLSHVCSRWRTLACHTSELWNNIHLTNVAYVERSNHYPEKPLQEWIRLAANSTVALSFDSTSSTRVDGDAHANNIQSAVSPFKFKTLRLDIAMNALTALSKFPHSILPDIQNLRFTITSQDIYHKLSIMPHMLVRLQSLTLFCQRDANPEIFMEQFPLPWSQLRYLDLRFIIKHLTPTFAVLEQIPNLEGLDIVIALQHGRPLDSPKKLTMPYLQTMIMAIAHGYLDEILPYFTCPSLTSFTLTGYGAWTDKTFEIIKQQYNAQRLHKIRFHRCPLPVSSILRDAPLLRALSVKQHNTVTMDGDAITGIANGTLGRHLTKLSINATGIVDAIAEMGKKRKGLAEMLIENGCNWREAITILRDITGQHGNEWHYVLGIGKDEEDIVVTHRTASLNDLGG